MIAGHGGNVYQVARRLGCRSRDIIDMSSNINPLGPPPGLKAFLRENLDVVGALPEVAADSAVQAFADRFHIDPRRVIPGNGTTQMIYCLPDALNLKKVLIIGPTYSDYGDACHLRGTTSRYLITASSDGFQPDIEEVSRQASDADAVFFCNPNNPTGTFVEIERLRELCRSRPETLFIVDESYLPFVGCGDRESMMTCDMDNVVVLHSMSKIFSIPGLRIGFLVSSPAIVNRLRPHLLPWSVNALAQAAVVYLMNREVETGAFIERSVSFLENEKFQMAERLSHTTAIRFFRSRTSFLLARLTGQLTADSVCDALMNDRILVRDCANFVGLSSRYIRISIKTAEANARVVQGLLNINREAAAGYWPSVREAAR